jgi:hypothetical protein
MKNTRGIGISGLLLLGTLSGCMATVGASMMSVPPDSAQRCYAHCQAIGLNLTAVAIMANNVGCVCQPPAQPPVAAQASTTAGGMTAILMQEEAAASQQAAQRQHMHMHRH